MDPVSKTSAATIGTTAGWLAVVAALFGGAADAAEAQRRPPLPGGKIPHFKIEALSFRCNDETGYDSPWWAPWISDEVRVAASSGGRGFVSREFGDVDSGEHRNFPADEACILPIADRGSGSNTGFVFGDYDKWGCNEIGAPGPFEVSVVFAEVDSGIWADCFSSFPPGCRFGPPDAPDFNDDLIGRKTLAFPLSDLLAAMPHVGDIVEETAILGECYDEDTCVTTPGGPSPAEYTFTYRVTRLPDNLPPLVRLP